jgi:hypothetical protein
MRRSPTDRLAEAPERLPAVPRRKAGAQIQEEPRELGVGVDVRLELLQPAFAVVVERTG